jgi:hypothetical protein
MEESRKSKLCCRAFEYNVQCAILVVMPWVVAACSVGSAERSDIGSVPAVTSTASDTSELIRAINDGAQNDTVIVAAGTFELTEPLRPKPGMTIQGAGKGQTVIKNAPSWALRVDNFADSGTDFQSIACNSYLFSLPEKTTNLHITDMTLQGPGVLGAICGILPNGLEIARVEFRSFLWSAVRTFIMENANIHDNEFIDAGGWNAKAGFTGGALFLNYVKRKCSP